MKRYLLTITLSAALAALSGCSQNAGSGSSGTADRDAGTDRQLPQKTGSPSNVEQGSPPGSRVGGTGPAKGSPGAGSNPGATSNGESAPTTGARPNPNPK